MNKEEQQKLSKFVAEYIEKDVTVEFNRLSNENTLLAMITEAVNEYSDRMQIIDKKKQMRKSLSVAREACAGSQSPFINNASVINLMRESMLLAFKLGLGRIRDNIEIAYKKLLTNLTIGGRIDADQILCKLINDLDKEIKDALV